MSYILEALRKAAQEREQGAVPGLTSQPTSRQATRRAWNGTTDPHEDPPRWRELLPIWAPALLILGLLAAGAWWLLRATPAKTPPLVHAASDKAKGRPEPLDAVTTAAMAPSAEPQRGSGAHKSSRPAALTAEPARLTSEGKPRGEQPESLAFAPQSQEGGSKAPAAGAAAPPRLENMSIAFQQGIPKLTVSGAMVSEDAASRILILNGQVLHEGEKAAPDLVLERIGHKSAILSHRGTRFELRY